MRKTAESIMSVSALSGRRGWTFSGRASHGRIDERRFPMIIDPSVIRQVSREKDIDPEKMFAALEEAMSSAARKFYRDKAVVTAIDRKSGEMSVTSRRTVVEELDTESEEPPPQILLAEAQELVLSRTDPRLLIRLFEMEVPEIYDGTVVIKGAVRQPGERAKVAVRSRERDVDPVGACVGMRGSRVQSIMRELHGEKINVILYSDDLITFAQNALSPAKITRVSPIHHEDGPLTLDCVVEDEQLSLAIGKKGQNVRL